MQVAEKQRLAHLVLQLQEDMEEMRTVSWGGIGAKRTLAVIMCALLLRVQVLAHM